MLPWQVSSALRHCTLYPHNDAPLAIHIQWQPDHYHGNANIQSAGVIHSASTRSGQFTGISPQRT